VKDEVSMVEGYTQANIKGAESYTATGFSSDFENSFEGNTKREKILRYHIYIRNKIRSTIFCTKFSF
jgi:hypothetical protein